MQNQLIPGQTNLQQSNNSLQPNSSNLQQSDTPATSSGVSDVLSQTYPGQLTVQSRETQVTDTPQTFLPGDSNYGWLLAGLVVVTVIIAAAVWLYLRPTNEVESADIAPEPIKAPPVVATKKKRASPKKTTRKQRARKR